MEKKNGRNLFPSVRRLIGWTLGGVLRPTVQQRRHQFASLPAHSKSVIWPQSPFRFLPLAKKGSVKANFARETYDFSPVDAACIYSRLEKEELLIYGRIRGHLLCGKLLPFLLRGLLRFHCIRLRSVYMRHYSILSNLYSSNKAFLLSISLLKLRSVPLCATLVRSKLNLRVIMLQYYICVHIIKIN